MYPINQGQTIKKTMAKPVDMVKKQEKPIIWNKALRNELIDVKPNSILM